MPKQEVKTLKSTCQETLTKYLDGKTCYVPRKCSLMYSFYICKVLLDVGCIPYSLIKDSLVHATPQQLYKIERSNPVSLNARDPHYNIILQTDFYFFRLGYHSNRI